MDSDPPLSRASRRDFIIAFLGTRGTNQADKWVGVASRAHGARDPGTHAAGSAPGRAKNMGGCDISAVGRPFLRYNE